MKRKIVLASQSPRRRDLLEQIGLRDFEIRESEYEEDMSAMDDPRELAKFLSLKKAEDVARHYEDAIIIAGDTFTIFEGEFIGKPKNREDAKKILKKFSDKEHFVVSGFALIDTKSGKVINNFGEAKVKFKKLDDEEIENYLNSDLEEILGMAGAYGLMNKAAPLVERIEGDFFAIIGLPLNKVYEALKELGVDVYES